MRGALILAVLALAACDPRAPELDGAPERGGVSAATGDAPGELAGAGPSAPDAVQPAVIGIVPPMGVQVIDNCESAIAADYANPPEMACLLFQTEDFVEGKIDAGVFVAISEAGWNFIRAQGAEHYFERPRAGSDCAEVAVVSVLTDRLQAVTDRAGADKPTGSGIWQAYAIPVSTREACGADRMKP